jgi:hypothetical protein
LFPSELEQNKELSYDELIELFMNKFPAEIVEDQETMSQLNELSTRIENIGLKYKYDIRVLFSILFLFNLLSGMLQASQLKR